MTLRAEVTLCAKVFSCKIDSSAKVNLCAKVSLGAYLTLRAKVSLCIFDPFPKKRPVPISLTIRISKKFLAIYFAILKQSYVSLCFTNNSVTLSSQKSKHIKE